MHSLVSLKPGVMDDHVMIVQRIAVDNFCLAIMALNCRYFLVMADTVALGGNGVFDSRARPSNNWIPHGFKKSQVNMFSISKQ